MVKQGYKQTEVGIIPEDWMVDTINSVTLSVATGGNYKNSTQRSPYPLIKMGNLSRGHINLNKIEYVIDAIPSEKDRLSYGDVLFNTRNTPELVGKVAIWKNELPIAYFNSNLLRFNFNLEKSNPFFMNLIFNTKQVIAEFKNISKGTTSVAAIYPNDMLKVIINIPPIQEQNSIAKALSDVDNMISSLEKLIAKKKAVKQGAMQELLTGKKRLPGFTGEWEAYKLDELLQYEQPTKYIVHSAKYAEQGIPVLTAGKSLILGYTTENDGIYENLPVIIFDDFVTSSKYITYRFKVKSSAMKMLTLKNEEMNLKLIFELMQMIDFVPVDHQRHWISQYSQFEIKLPPTIEEQTAIASILADMDNEIEALEQKFEKTRQIKQGMMQQLLTGKIRLV